MPPDSPTAPAATWSDLVSAALVGTARRSVPQPAGLPAVERDDPALALLDRAALAAVRRRAGRTALRVPPDSPGRLPQAAPDTAPEVPGPAVLRLSSVLNADTPLLREWLGLAAERGMVVPPDVLPDLLNRGARDHDLGRLMVRVVGERGRWLAAVSDRWSYLDRLSQSGEFTVEEWRAKGAEGRRALLEAREPLLSAADEPLLEEAMADRSARVRGIALALLAQLPGTERGARLADLARRHVLLHDGAVEIRPPAADDPDIPRELGLASATGTRSEVREERLWALVTHAPLDCWLGHLGADPDEVAAAACAHNELLDTLGNAAVVQRRPDWARALLPLLFRSLSRHHHVRASRAHALVGLLPPDEQCAWAMGHAKQAPTGRGAASALLAAVECVECPWSLELGGAVADVLAAASGNDSGLHGLARAAEYRMPPELHPRMTDAARARQGTPSDPPTSDELRVAEILRSLAEKLRVRHEMHKEFH
ncbi:hypothetical protein HNR12_000310 [Streptomonospora nanhaiensis]|uniref:Uncharacterized protein n=1 Tax=Streptomonospora nanhaiensis TaxID=1323731 RepID=A0A853BFC4_9ACTN|nr:hypothetical protein [Streptomonospora nanhaiensis]